MRPQAAKVTLAPRVPVTLRIGGDFQRLVQHWIMGGKNTIWVFKFHPNVKRPQFKLCIDFPNVRACRLKTPPGTTKALVSCSQV